MTRALRISVFALIAAAAALLASPPAEALLEKHNCSFCHSLHGGPTPGGSTQFVPEFSPTNVEVLCLGCHFNEVDGSLPPYNSDTDGIPAAAVQPHRSDGSHPEFHVTCIDCHEHHDNMPNWLSDPSAPPHQTHDPAFTGIPGVNQKMVGRIDPDELTDKATVITREWDGDRNGVPDRGAAVTQTCNEAIVNDCYTEERRYVVFEQFDPASPLHAWAENNDTTGPFEDPADYLGPSDPIVVRSNESDSGALVQGTRNWSAHDSLCGMCHTRTANHNLLTGGGLSHNDGRRCTDCHTHDTCFDRSSCGTPVPEQPARDLHVVSGTLIAVPTSVSPGQTVTLSVDVENLGDRFEGVDVRFSSNIEGFIGRTRVELDELNSGGEFATASFDWVTSAGGSHEITAQIEPQLSEVDTTNNSDTVVDLVTVAAPSPLTLVKTATPLTYSAVNDVINYSYLVENVGSVALAGPVTIADDKSTDEACPAVSTVGNNDGNLDPGEQITCTATYTITAADISAGSVTNIATASADGETSPSDSATVTGPAISMVKTATPQTFSAENDVIAYSYLVTNTGSVPLAGPVTIADDKSVDEACPAVSTVGNNDGNLDPGEQITCTASYTITAGDVTAGSVTNIATATIDGVTSPSDTETVTFAPAAVADVSVNITDDGGSCQNPCTRPVQVDVSNAGPDAISSVTVDLSSDLDGLLDTNTTGTILSGGTVTITLNWTIDGTTTAGRHDLTAVTVPLDLGGQDPDTTNNTDTVTSKRVN